jgi:hypothetical protein
MIIFQDAKEEAPSNLPSPRGLPVQINLFIEVNKTLSQWNINLPQPILRLKRQLKLCFQICHPL